MTREGAEGAVAMPVEVLLFSRGLYHGVVDVAPSGSSSVTISLSSLDWLEGMVACLVGGGYTVGQPVPSPTRLVAIFPARFVEFMTPAEFVAALQTTNEFDGLPRDSLRLRGSAAERGRGRGGAVGPRIRVWVDVSPDGMRYVEGADFYLRTLTGSIRLSSLQRDRHRSDNS